MPEEKEIIAQLIKHKLSELHRLENKIHRYQKRLLKEGLLIAKELGFSKMVVNEDGISIESSDPALEGIKYLEMEQLEDDFFDTTPLAELAKIKFPSLYRKYWNLRLRYAQCLEDLKKLMQKNKQSL